MKNIFIALVIFCCGLNSQDLISPQHSFFQPNNINTIFYNNGIYNYDKITFPGGDAGFIWPVNSGTRLTAAFSSGIWIAAKVQPNNNLRLAASFLYSHFSPGNIPVIGQVPPLSVCNDSSWKVYLVNLNDPLLVNGGTRTKTAGGRTYSFNYTSWADWPIAKGAPYIEINNVPGYQPGWNSDRPGIGNGSLARPEEICFSVYMDYTECTNNIHPTYITTPGGTLPLGAEIHQVSFAFNCPTLKNIIFIQFKIINKSAYTWDSTYISSVNDLDIGDYMDDAFGCDSAKNLCFTYNEDNMDQQYGINPPALGTGFLRSPIIYTGSNYDTVKLPNDTLIGYKMLNMTSGVIFDEISNPYLAYNSMRGYMENGDPIINFVTGQRTKFMYSGDACRRIGWIDSIGSEVRYIQSTGPFNLNSGDTQVLTISYVISSDGGNNFQNVCALQSLSDSALKYYYNDFQTCIPIGIQSISTEVPDRFMLYQNYPNPFNPTTRIKFSIPPVGNGSGRSVQVIIYDLLGRELTTLINENLSPGTYEVDFDGTNYSSGVYYYRLITDSHSETKKMLMIK